MADKPATTEPSLIDKLVGGYQSANAQFAGIMGKVGGGEAEKLANESFADFKNGKIMDGVKTGFEANGKVLGHMYDEVKGAVGK